jgi:hypothetical protein
MCRPGLPCTGASNKLESTYRDRYAAAPAGRHLISGVACRSPERIAQGLDLVMVALHALSLAFNHGLD